MQLKYTSLAIALVMAIAPAGCVPVVSINSGMIVTKQKSVERVVDDKIGAAILFDDPRLPLGRAQCPEDIDLSDGHETYCHIPIGTASLSVSATSPERGEIFVKSMKAVFTRRTFETIANREFLKLGVASPVSCGPKEIYLVEQGNEFDCRARGAGATGIVRITIDNGGHAVPEWVKKPKLPSWLASAVAAHTVGHVALVDGADVAPLIEKWSSDGLEYRGYTGPPPRVHCPPKLDLSTEQSGLCSVAEGGEHVRFRVRLSDDPAEAIVYDPVDTLVSLDHLELVANRSMQFHLPADDEDRFEVTCGKGYVVVTAPHDIACTGSVKNHEYTLTFKVVDPEGRTDLDYAPK